MQEANQASAPFSTSAGDTGVSPLPIGGFLWVIAVLVTGGLLFTIYDTITLPIFIADLVTLVNAVPPSADELLSDPYTVVARFHYLLTSVLGAVLSLIDLVLYAVVSFLFWRRRKDFRRWGEIHIWFHVVTTVAVLGMMYMSPAGLDPVMLWLLLIVPVELLLILYLRRSVRVRHTFVR